MVLNILSSDGARRRSWYHSSRQRKATGSCSRRILLTNSSWADFIRTISPMPRLQTNRTHWPWQTSVSLCQIFILAKNHFKSGSPEIISKAAWTINNANFVGWCRKQCCALCNLDLCRVTNYKISGFPRTRPLFGRVFKNLQFVWVFGVQPLWH